MDSHWLAWLGGLIDGEGTIGLHRANAKNWPRPYLCPHLQIANTDIRLLRKAAEIIEGVTGKPSHKLVVTNKHRGERNWKVGYRLAVTTKWEIALLLVALRPYLVGKTEQADVVHEFCIRRHGRETPGRRGYSDLDIDEALYLRCLALNRRGLPPSEELERMLPTEG